MAYKRSSLLGSAEWLRAKAVFVVLIWTIGGVLGWSLLHALTNLATHLQVALSLGKLTFNQAAADAQFQSGITLSAAVGFVYGLSKGSNLFRDARQLEWMAKVEEHLEAIRSSNGDAKHRHQQLDQRTDISGPSGGN